MKRKIDSKLFEVYDESVCQPGGNQNWFSKKMHRINGCGPATAALITLYMSAVAPAKCAALYPYTLPAKKQEFIQHMEDVRSYVKPGFFGLTNPNDFTKAICDFARSRGIRLKSQNIFTSHSEGVAFGFIMRAINEGYMPALLVLRNPSDALKSFTWHWMAVTGYDDEKRTVYVTSNTKEYELNFRSVWNQQKPYRTNCVYFFPE